MGRMSNGIEYRKLPVLFCILTLSGVWCPRDWRLPSKRIYRLYTLLQVTAASLFWLGILVNILLSGADGGGGGEHVYENLFALSTLSCAMYKDLFVLRNNKLIVRFLQLCFQDEWYAPRDNVEARIAEKYGYESRWITQAYAAGIVAALAVKACAPMLRSQSSSWALPIAAWYPYRIDRLASYLLAYAQELLGGVPLICLHIAVDSLFVTLVLQLCAKLAILKHRMRAMCNRYGVGSALARKLHRQADDALATYAEEHERILQFARSINSAFQGILRGQLMATIPNICTNVYLLSRHSGAMGLDVVDSFMCFATCLMQIFLFCWYGNKITLDSADVANAAFHVNWTALTVRTQKKLLTIMMRATRTITFAAGTFVMNLDSFIEIIKTSYSAFRVLQNT